MLSWAYNGYEVPKNLVLDNLTQEEFMFKVHSGVGGNAKGNGYVINVYNSFGGQTPKFKDLNQDTVHGLNDLVAAKLGTKMYSYSGPYDVLDQWERGLFAAIEKFNAKSKLLEFSGISSSGVRDGFSGDLNSDLSAVIYSIVLVCIYCVINMGSCSPIHFRSLGSAITLVCVGLSYTSSNGLASLLGFESSRMHQMLPFMLLGVGVDDMFVIASTID